MKIAELLVVGVLASSVGVFAKGGGGHASSHSSSHSSSSHSSTAHTPTTPHTSTPHTTSKPSWSSSAKYGSGKSSQVGKGSLKSKTTLLQPHDYQGKKYNSSNAIYTNNRGRWVYYWSPLGVGGVACYDKDHKRVDCNRDDKAYSKDW